MTAAKLARNPEEKQELVKALGGFRDPALAKSAMELTLGNDFDGRDAMDLLLAPTANLTTRDLPFRFVQEHYDALLTRMPGSGSPRSRKYLRKFSIKSVYAARFARRNCLVWPSS
jgi:hypothetical protein